MAKPRETIVDELTDSAQIEERLQTYLKPFQFKKAPAKTAGGDKSLKGRSFVENKQRSLQRFNAIHDPVLQKVVQLYHLYQQEQRARMQEVQRIRVIQSDPVLEPYMLPYFQKLSQLYQVPLLKSDDAKNIRMILQAFLKDTDNQVSDEDFRNYIRSTCSRLDIGLEQEDYLIKQITQLLKAHPWYQEVVLPVARNFLMGEITASALLEAFRSPSLFPEFKHFKQYSGLVDRAAPRADKLPHSNPNAKRTLYIWWLGHFRGGRGNAEKGIEPSYWYQQYLYHYDRLSASDRWVEMVKRYPFGEWETKYAGKKKATTDLYALYDLWIDRKIKNKATQVTQSYFLEELYNQWRAWES